MILEIKKVTLPELPFLGIDVQLNAFLFYIQHDYYTIKKSRTQVLFCTIYRICWKKESFAFFFTFFRRNERGALLVKWRGGQCSGDSLPQKEKFLFFVGAINSPSST